MSHFCFCIEPTVAETDVFGIRQLILFIFSFSIIYKQRQKTFQLFVI